MLHSANGIRPDVVKDRSARRGAGVVIAAAAGLGGEAGSIFTKRESSAAVRDEVLIWPSGDRPSSFWQGGTAKSDFWAFTKGVKGGAMGGEATIRVAFVGTVSVVVSVSAAVVAGVVVGVGVVEFVGQAC